MAPTDWPAWTPFRISAQSETAQWNAACASSAAKHLFPHPSTLLLLLRLRLRLLLLLLLPLPSAAATATFSNFAQTGCSCSCTTVPQASRTALTTAQGCGLCEQLRCSQRGVAVRCDVAGDDNVADGEPRAERRDVYVCVCVSVSVSLPANPKDTHRVSRFSRSAVAAPSASCSELRVLVSPCSLRCRRSRSLCCCCCTYDNSNTHTHTLSQIRFVVVIGNCRRLLRRRRSSSMPSPFGYETLRNSAKLPTNP